MTTQPKSNITNITILITIALLLAAGTMYALITLNNDTTSTETQPTSDPLITMENDAITIGQPQAPHTIQLYEDPLCPACGEFTATNHYQLTKAIQDGQLSISYRFLNFLDNKSISKDYSTRAVTALQCVAKNEPLNSFQAFNDSIFKNQPRINDQDATPRENTDHLIQQASDIGVTPNTINCMTSMSDEDLDYAKTSAENNFRKLQEYSDPRPLVPAVDHEGSIVDTKNPEWLTDILSN